MSERFYSDARLYDRLFPGGEPAVDFYTAEADCKAGVSWNSGAAPEHKLIPIASDGHPCTGLELSSDMLTESRKATSRKRCSGGQVTGRDLDPAARSISCSSQPIHRSICMRLRIPPAASDPRRAHLAPGARFIFDVFNPNVRSAHADGVHAPAMCPRSWIPPWQREG